MEDCSFPDFPLACNQRKRAWLRDDGGAVDAGGLGDPGKIAGKGIDDTSPISAVDLLPAFRELAGAKIPEGHAPDGLSQVPVVKGEATTTRTKPPYWKMGGGATPPEKPGGRSDGRSMRSPPAIPRRVALLNLQEFLANPAHAGVFP